MTLIKQSCNEFVSEKQKPLIVAGIPAYNEERTIAKLVLCAQKYVDVVLVCDDGSSDSTAEIAERMGASVIRHETNKGYGCALKSLFDVARDLEADVLVTFDGDGQHDPSEIPDLIKPLLEDTSDVVLGSRFIEPKKNEASRSRRLGIKFLSKLTGVACSHKIVDGQCGFRAYGSTAISELRLSENGMGASAEVLLKAKKQGLKICEVSTSCKYDDLHRTSTQNPIAHATSVILTIFRLIIEEKPLTCLGIPSLILLGIGAFFGIWMLRLFVEYQTIVTNIALASMGFLLIGMFMLFTAITLYAVSLQSKNN